MNSLVDLFYKEEEVKLTPSEMKILSSSDRLLALSDNGLHVCNAEVSSSLAKKKLSASMVTSLENCPASWLFSSFVMPKLQVQDAHSALTRGSLFHKVMEDFFRLPVGKRTKKSLEEVTNKVLKGSEFSFANTEENREWLNKTLLGYIGLKENPNNVEIAYYSPNGSNRISEGLETFISAKFDGCKRPIIGFVDQLVKKEDGILIRDWKTSDSAKVYNPKLDKTKGYSEQRQQRIYASMIALNIDTPIKGAQLVYPRSSEIVEIDLSNKSLNERAIQEVKVADEALQEYENSNEFPFKPSVLCAWCPFSKMCPKSLILKKDKFQEAQSSQPSAEQIADYVMAI